MTILNLDSSKLKATSERDFTVIVSLRLPNACAIHKLLSEYAKEATNLIENIYLIELADGGLTGLFFLALYLFSWRFSLKDLEAFDIESSQRAACLSVHLPS